MNILVPAPLILLTRPIAASEHLAEELEARGYHTLIEPLLMIEPRPAPLPPGAFDAVIITSANALVGLADRRAEAEKLFTLPCFCVGERTAAAASAFGFQNVRSGDEDGAALTRQMTARLPPAQKILHIAGEDVKEGAADGLRAAGHMHIHWPVYKAVAATALSTAVREALTRQEISGALFFSARTAAIFVNLIKAARLEACCATLHAIGLSEAVTSLLHPIDWKSCRAAEAPTEQAMINLLPKAPAA